jgi:D-ala-D-ala dipeptidase
LHRNAEPAGGPGGEGQGSVVSLGDAFDDCEAEAEADSCVVGAYAFGAATKRLGKRGSQLWGELLAGVLDSEHHAQVVGSVGCEHFMDERSHHGARGVSGIEAQNRGTLCSIMEHSGFERYDHEWWHYALRDEPYPDTYFDFPIL